MSIASTQEIIAELKAGRMVILVDEEDRENEGDLMLAADFVTPEAINFMIRFARGLVCLTLTQECCERLNLPLMTPNNGTQYNTAFTVSIEAAQGVTTGVSPADRARTVQAAVARNARATDIVQPGHIFPVAAQPGGVLVRAGHTEAGCDLTRLAGLTPAAVICEVINDDGSMARLPDLIDFAAKHSLKIGTIADLVQYRSLTESIIERVAERPMHTPHGAFHAVIYRDKSNGAPHIALVRGTPQPDRTTFVRVHEPMSVLDLLEIDGATHSWTLHAALQEIAASECGVIVLMNCSASKEYLFNAFEACNQPEKAAQLKHRPADFKTYGVGAQILRDLNVGKMHVLSSPRKLHAMSCYGLEVTGFAPMPGVTAVQ
ncbi:bifunctional 3,4-dihydroxy-2-butanone 4-phosphate synthase [Mycoavidus cysteinexigens]|uniref:3,4-dihydroxy-2-butanone 4-phosphate synthase n=1 Tax=Mycoavidus cysteinexigens TaxID=1553431 RepID=A0A2Z6ESE0_9BURK|nr:bifunctional 3,4-dihydroxy-2-butanone-4-phosphate synthase/GTP cyclohydrolase II [Mycoavidus cysteinexigens]BBE08311.1 bifunctional 3,4-dihydroxy-2-butanone 4-phosphate synthase [Mycoavidus cysteinexigens]GAM52986.1 3,4-dihydroxy-2-butanone 4-phosphate synthase [bacterium endosymbiont of Mortierella elongata FMR23-6]GLR00817.1 3,4-dihydroxy-2-butanone-4-phosphate synthase [Mycoavidus cysteinexigens]